VLAAPIAPPPANPTKLGAGKTGFFTPAILFQGWYTVDRNSGVTTDAFKLRRAEFHAKGQIIPDKVQYEINVDFAKVLETTKVTVPTTPTVDINNPQSKISALQDLYLTYLTKNAEISLGQHKIPVSWEGVNSSGKLLFVERSAVSKQFGDIRDIGLRVTKTFPKFMYMAGVYNGTGLNQVENNPGKDVSLRLEVYPVKGLTLAAVTYDSVFDRKQPTAKDRWEFDARYEKDAILVQAEAIIALTPTARRPTRACCTSTSARTTTCRTTTPSCRRCSPARCSRPTARPPTTCSCSPARSTTEPHRATASARLALGE
ncbi:MAG: OprO/OprP family phosphate-selective porin, partial [Deltaproteobacteria bacterium]|nr:OprO/OprP family phosphate-selective porin [Deltaproteobacteria bacterium]